jgi:hypothetical protein
MKSYISGCVITVHVTSSWSLLPTYVYSHRPSVNFLWGSSVHVVKYKTNFMILPRSKFKVIFYYLLKNPLILIKITIIPQISELHFTPVHSDAKPGGKWCLKVSKHMKKSEKHSYSIITFSFYVLLITESTLVLFISLTSRTDNNVWHWKMWILGLLTSYKF